MAFAPFMSTDGADAYATAGRAATEAATPTKSAAAPAPRHDEAGAGRTARAAAAAAKEAGAGRKAGGAAERARPTAARRRMRDARMLVALLLRLTGEPVGAESRVAGRLKNLGVGKM